jgi:hypothetical protein
MGVGKSELFGCSFNLPSYGRLGRARAPVPTWVLATLNAFRNAGEPPPQLTGRAPPGSLKGVFSPKFREFHVAVKSIQLGQVWRNDTDGQDYLVTKIYSEVFTQYALLRPAGLSAPDVATVRVKVAKSAEGASLPGYTFTQEGAF